MCEPIVCSAARAYGIQGTTNSFSAAWAREKGKRGQSIENISVELESQPKERSDPCRKKKDQHTYYLVLLEANTAIQIKQLSRVPV